MRKRHHKIKLNTPTTDKGQEQHLSIDDSINLLSLERQIRNEIFLLSDMWIDSKECSDDEFIETSLSFFIEGCIQHGHHVLFICNSNEAICNFLQIIYELYNDFIDASQKRTLYIKNGHIKALTIHDLAHTRQIGNYDHVVVMLDHLLYSDYMRNQLISHLPPILLNEPCKYRKLWIKCNDRSEERN